VHQLHWWKGVKWIVRARVVRLRAAAEGGRLLLSSAGAGGCPGRRAEEGAGGWLVDGVGGGPSGAGAAAGQGEQADVVDASAARQLACGWLATSRLPRFAAASTPRLAACTHTEDAGGTELCWLGQPAESGGGGWASGTGAGGWELGGLHRLRGRRGRLRWL
jgi:hypothetical protein